MLEAAQPRGRYRLAMNRAVNAFKALITDEIGYMPMSRGRPTCSARSSRSATNAAR
jgi:hypothetical protein